VATERLVRERFSMKCPNCRTKELVVIEMVVGGRRVTLHSCSSCDLRWWETTEGTTSLAEVLDLAAVAR
jgi:transcription elongation factor Elf1